MYLDEGGNRFTHSSGKGMPTIDPSICEEMAINLANNLGEDCHYPFMLERDGYSFFQSSGTKGLPVIQ